MRKKTLALTLIIAFSWLLGGGDLMGQGPVYTIGSGSSTTSYIPLRTGNNYSYSEQIYTATELTNAGCPEGSITKIAFKMSSNTSTSIKRKLDIYMKSTTKTSFEGNSDVVNVESSDLVYSSGDDDVSFSYNQWTVIALDNAFDWDGVSNVLVLIYDKTGSSTSSYSFYYYSSSSNSSIYYYNSSAITNITSLPNANGRSGKNIVQLTIEASSTPRPKNLAFSNIGANTATVSWTSPSNAVIDYTYQYQLSGGDWSSPIGENTISGTAANLSGLTAKRSYDVRIRANYENSQTSEWVTKSFNTAVNLPYSYGFEDASELNFWTLKDANASTNIENGNAHQGSKSFKFYGTGSNQYLISPILVTASSGVHVEFYYKISNSSYSQKLKVGYSTSDINSFTFSDDVITVNSTSYPNESVKFDFPYDNIKYIAIQFDRNSNYQSTYIDDISISTCTTCVSPSDVTCTAVSATSATLGWTSNVGSYEIYITDDENDVPDSNSTTDITSNTESKTIYGLSAGTTYYAYVRACCDEESKSDWSSVCQFTPTVSQSTTVNNVGTETTNNHVPFYGMYASKTDTQGQYIIPASALSALANGQITKLAVYGTANQSFTSTFKVHLAEVSQTTLSSIYTGDMVEVYSGTLATDASGLMEIEFSTPYNYNGNNLLVDFIITTAGNTQTTTWVGITTTENTAYYQYKGALNVIYAYGEKHLPKTTLTYIPSIEFNSDGNWNTATNWEINTLPATTYNVTIDAACTIPSGCDAEVNNIIINSGESLTVASGGSLTVNGTMTVEGTMTINGTFNYSEEPENLVIEDGGQLILPKTSTGIQATVKKETKAATAKDDDKYYWYTISSAVENPSISSATNIETGTYDFYRYNEVKNAELPWENYKNTAYSSTFTTLEQGRGYLYRNAANLSITMTGDINVADIDYPVTKTGEGVLAGFNLIGNPYSHNIYKGAGTAIPNVSDEEDLLRIGFYYMEPTTGKWTLGTDNSTAIKPNEAIFVQTDANGNIEMTNINSDGSSKANNDYIMFKVANSQYSDETYAWFDKGRGLNKINHRNAEVPMLYINQDGEDYAIATMSDDTKTFSLNFKAMTMGKYTLSYKTKGEFNYLHVIDRLTGEDVNMLLEGEYSFIASTQDSENRFIVSLEYSSNDANSDSSIFAYQNGNDIIVIDEGELQVFDVTGRKVMNAAINSSFETISGLSKGFYIFKLNEKTQKIVVR